MQKAYSVGQFVRLRKPTSGIYEVLRVLPIEDHGSALYLIRNERGLETIARHDEIERA